MVTVFTRTIDGQVRVAETFLTREEAVQWLIDTADECRETHKRVQLCLKEGILIVEYGGDDTTLYFID
jgi:hypothetical protein